MRESRVIPESLDVHALHELCNGPIAVRSGILRVLPRLEEGRAQVDLFFAVNAGKGMMNFHIIHSPKQAGGLIEMLQHALMLVGGRDA